MNAIEKRCRPKHQVLVLKCYPRTTKGAVDVKPNSSELSYLLFYAQSRRSKIQKIGAFLEKKTASDVYRMRIGNVQVTLQILAALIDKSPKDLPLIAPCVLKILDQILRSGDITLVESSVPTFEAFCEHHDVSSLLADQAYMHQYEAVVRQYAALASTKSFPGKVQPSKPVAMRWRISGLETIRSVASCDALSSVSGGHYDVVVPMILQNLWTDHEEFLEVLQQRSETEGKADAAPLLRRASVATVGTADAAGDTNPIALSGSAVDVDKLAEEDIGVLAMQCLKQIFVVPNRSQLHAATLSFLKFIQERLDQNETVLKTSPTNGRDFGWAIKMWNLITHWAPVQDRYTILVTALDHLSKMPLLDENLQRHIVLIAMIGSLLRSDVNLIGLSVIDALAQLLTHMRLLVHMPGDPSTLGLDAPRPGTRQATAAQLAEQADTISAQRRELLYRLQVCIGDLATHVYYADQISDIISTILAKLRPSRPGQPPGPSSPEKPEADGGLSGSAASLEDQHLDSLFSLPVGKIAALKAIKSVLLVANPRTKMAGNVNLSRNRVPVQVWEGTQWLLRDRNGLVRKAYADAVLTWLDRETTRADVMAKDVAAGGYQRSPPRDRELLGAVPGRRFASGPPIREKQVKTARSHFLQLLHVAIYENALEFVEYEIDMVLLHVLLFKLVKQLGVNAVRYGLPMVFRLQEDIQEAETPIAKVRMGCLCHGYLWILTEIFDIEATTVGKAIHNEIIRRRSKHFWIEGIHVPPPLLELIGTPGNFRSQPRMPLKEIESEALLPFDDRASLVESICASYRQITISPPVSPAASPSRSFSHPILSPTLGAIPSIEAAQELPATVREEMMLSEWSREAVLSTVQADSKSASLSGSRTGTSTTNRHRLGVNGLAATNGRPSPSPRGSLTNLRPLSSPAGGNAALALRQRKPSLRGSASPMSDGSSSTTPKGGLVTSVSQLKLALNGQLQPPPPLRLHTATDAVQGDDDSTDSMASYDMTPSEFSFNPATAETGTDVVDQVRYSMPRMTSFDRRPTSIIGGPLTSHPMHDNEYEREQMGEVPPVPPLPDGLERRPSVPPHRRGVTPQPHGRQPAGERSRAGAARARLLRLGQQTRREHLHWTCNLS